MVLDGSTTGRDSGLLARRVARDLIDGYVSAEAPPEESAVLARLREVHEDVRAEFPQGSASYVLALIQAPDNVRVMHAGDCLCGHVADAVAWLCKPHTLANAIEDIPVAALAGLPARHKVTRSFRARAFMAPEAFQTCIAPRLILASDGFWADLSTDNQLSFLDGADLALADDGDDRSVLQITVTDTPHHIEQQGEADSLLYVRRREDA